MENVRCDLCGAADYEVVWDKGERDKEGLLQSTVIPGHIHSRNVMCRRCGLVFVSPKMSKEELDKFYTEDYRKIYDGQHSIQSEKNHAETAFGILKDQTGIMYEDYPELEHLDIGCSTGELIFLTDGHGIEPNTEHYEIAKSKGLNVENCSIEHYAPGFKFDIITMLNALEHVYSPTDVLNKIHDLLNDDGHVLISVPNIYNRTIHIPTDTFLSNAHLYNFSIDTLTQFYLKCGFKIVKQYQITEEMGDKIYLLGQKIDKKQDYVPKIDPKAIGMTREHLKIADVIWHWKYRITQMGFK